MTLAPLQRARPVREAAVAPSRPVTTRPGAAAPAASAAIGVALCACGGGCPRCTRTPRAATQHRPTLEEDADRAADQVLAMPAPTRGLDDDGTGAPSDDSPRSAGGVPLDAGLRAFFEPRFARRLGHVRLHTDAAAARRAREVRAAAFASGADVFFAEGRYAPWRPSGLRLLAHELAHVVQQTAPHASAEGPVKARADGASIARSVDDWLAGTVDLRGFTYTQLLDELDALGQYLERQTESSEDTVRIGEAIASLRAEIDRRDAAARPSAARGGGPRDRRRTTATAAVDAPLPDRYPRVLLETTSVAYADPAEMRAEYDLVMQWLGHADISRQQRRILQEERDNLAPQLQVDRERVATARHAERLRAALTPADRDDGHALETLAATIEGIAADPADPAVSYLHDGAERIAIGAEQAEQLRRGLASELRRAADHIDIAAVRYWERYQSQRAIDRDSPIVAGISGWLADVEDPAQELSSRYFWLRGQTRTLRQLLRLGRAREAAAMLPAAERVGQEIRALARAYYEGQIEGAEAALHGLQLTRDASFAIAGSIAAVVAAPVVAGFAGGLGLGTAGTAVATTLGTSAIVGTGMGAVRSGSAALGTGLAGGSLAEVREAFLTEGARGLREGAISGATAGAARFLGPALGVGAEVGGQMLRRIAAEAILNGTSTMLDVLIQTRSIREAARAGAIAAVLSVPGGVLGGAESPIVREFVAPFAAGATAYLGAIANGASRQEAIEAAGIALASNMSMSRATHGSREDAALEERGRATGLAVRRTAVGSTDADGTHAPAPSADVVTPTPAAVAAAPDAAPPGDATPALDAAPAVDAVAATTPVPSPVDDLNIDAAFSESAPFQGGESTEITRTGAGRSSSVRSLGSIALNAAQHLAAIALHGQRLGGPLSTAWNASRNPREVADIQTIRNHVAAGRMEEARVLARQTFDRHRSRFWRRVRASPEARAAFTDAGMVFPPGDGGPVYRDPATGDILDRMTLEHSTRLADDPVQALEATNLQTVLGDENSFALEAIRRLDPFQ